MAERDRDKEGLEHRAKGTAKEFEGKARKNVGDATDDTSEQLKGHAQETKGKAQKEFGKAKQDSAEDGENS